MKLLNNSVIVFSGAGLSVDSGIPSYSDGLWAEHDVNKYCNIETWKQNMRDIKEFYSKFKQMCLSAEAHDGHRSLLKLESYLGDRAVNITMNVDNLLQRAGLKNVIELHGNMHSVMCGHCYDTIDIGNSSFLDNIVCECGNYKWFKPGVTFYGESAPNYKYLNELAVIAPTSTIVCVGTSFNVISPEMLNLRNFKRTYLINKHDTDYDELFDSVIKIDAKAGLPIVVDTIINDLT